MILRAAFVFSAYAFSALLACPLFADELADRLAAVPNPRPQGSWVSDPSGLITERKSDIDAAISALERESSAEIAVVVLPSIGSYVPKDFAVALFARWGIGKKGKDNGVLVLHILDQRRVEIETGYGIEGILPDVKCRWIIDDVMRPYFKRNQFADGHLEIVRAIVRGLKNPEISRENLIQTETAFQEGLEAPQQITDAGATAPGSGSSDPGSELPESITRFGPAGGGLGGIALYFLGWIVTTLVGIGKDPYRRYKIYQKGGWLFHYGSTLLFSSSAFAIEYPRTGTFWSPLVLLPIAGGLVYFLRSRKLRKLRDEPRSCPKCEKPMSRLTEETDDRYLQAGQIVEEQIQSIDYDVWVCDCGGTRIEPYDGNAPASICDRCHFKTYQLISTTTIRSATTTSEGLRELHYRCAYCKHEEIKQETIPRISTSSSSGGSSGGGSFGGGSSGGGGSGGGY